MTARRRWWAGAFSVVVAVASVAATTSAAWAWHRGRQGTIWATRTTEAGRHYGFALFSDAAVAYYVPQFPNGIPDPWSSWPSTETKSFQYVRSTRGALGFRWARHAINAGDVYLAVPYWALLTAAATPAVAVLVRLGRRRRTANAGLCTRCGYDLRATPDRCPECGAAGPRLATAGPPDHTRGPTLPSTRGGTP